MMQLHAHCYLIYLFVSRHKVHEYEHTHSAERRSIKTTKQHVVQGIEVGGITGLQTPFAAALKTEP